MTQEIREMLRNIDAIWSVNTAGFDAEAVIFTNDVWPTLRTMVGSLNLATNCFWQLAR